MSMTNVNGLKNYMMLFICGVIITLGCKKFLEIEKPIDRDTAGSVYSSTTTAAAAITGIYAYMSNMGYTVSDNGVSITGGILADELISTYPWIKPDIYINNLNGGDETRELWNSAYQTVIYRVNSIIKGVDNSVDISDNAKYILIGEAKFIRAFTYFYLVNMYGDVPLVIGTDLMQNSKISREPKDKVYNQIITDLLDAQALLKEDYLSTDLYTLTNERIRPNKGAATALLARVYLFSGEWAKAEVEATKLIENDSRYKLEEFSRVFLKNSTEAIWQLQPNLLDAGGLVNAFDARYFISPFAPRYSLTSFMFDDFENEDLRKEMWTSLIIRDDTSYRVPFKYTVGEKMTLDPQIQMEYTMVLRLAEQYLIRAEARAMQGKINGANSAETDINALRGRAGLPGTLAQDLNGMILEIIHERRVELFTEWGHRWLDLKRLKRIDDVMFVVTPLKGGVWASFKSLLPIPFNEFKTNTALIGHQNPGYTEQ